MVEPALAPVSPTATITIALTATNKLGVVPTDSARAYDDISESATKGAVVVGDDVADSPAVEDASDVDVADTRAVGSASDINVADAPAVIDSTRTAAQPGTPTGSCTHTALPRSKPTRLTGCKRIAQRAVQRMRAASAAVARRGARAKRAMTGCLTGGGAVHDGV